MKIVSSGDWWERALQLHFVNEQEFDEFLDRLRDVSWVRITHNVLEKENKAVDFLVVNGQAIIALYEIALVKPKEQVD